MNTTSQKQKKSSRHSGIELLRVMAAIGVIILHYNNEGIGGALKYATFRSGNRILLYFLEALNIGAVNIFIIINGFFDVNNKNRDLFKVLKLIAQVMIFSVINYLVTVSFGFNSFSLKSLVVSLIPNNWFVILYCTLFIISPFINVMLHKINIREYKILLIALLALFSIYPTLLDVLNRFINNPLNGISTIGVDGSSAGYTIVNFIMVYIIGGYIRLYIDKIYNTNKLLMILLINTILISLWAAFGYYFKIQVSCFEYCNPLVILEAIVIFLIFRNMTFKSEAINKLAKASFSVYLLHGYLITHLQIEKIIKINNPLLTLLHIIVCCAGIYLFSFIVNQVYAVSTKSIDKKIDSLWIRHRKYIVEY